MVCGSLLFGQRLTLVIGQFRRRRKRCTDTSARKRFIRDGKRAHSWNVSSVTRADGGGDSANSVEDLTNFPGESVNLVNAADLRITKSRPKHCSELAITVEAFVIQLDDENVFKTTEDV